MDSSCDFTIGMTSIYNSTTTTLLVDTTSTRKIVFLPVASTVGAGRLLWIKDISGNAGTNLIYISTIGMDRIENRFAPSTLFAFMSTAYSSVLMTSDGMLNWYFLQHYYRNAVSVGTAAGAISATGGTITTTASFKYHLFTSSSSFIVSSGSTTVNYLIVGGGGGGGDRHGGGGGGGGVLTGTWNVSVGTYTVTVGLGGVGGYYETGNSSPSGSGIKGGDSSLIGTGVSVTAYGGGGGGSYDGNPTGTVGSGGGGGGNSLAGVAGTAGQGNSGGSGLQPGGGGGGGAGGAGANANTSTGGIGTSSYSTHLLAVGYGTSFAVPTSPNAVISGGVAYIAAGGGGAAAASPGPGGSGGLGGGGRGDWNASNITQGTANTGGGGGGSRSDSEPSRGVDGGSGMILVWYAVSAPAERFPLVQTSNLIVKLDGASYSAGGSTWTSSVNSSVWSMGGTSYDAATQSVVFNSAYAYTSSVTSFNSTIHSVVMYYYRNGDSPNPASWSGYTSGGALYQINRSGGSADNEIVVYEPSMWDYSSGVGGLALAFNANTSLAGTTGWKMRAYVKNGATGTFYLNGVADGTATGSITASIGNGDFAIGRDYRDGIGLLNAKVALFAMWNVALTSTDITNIHNACKGQFGL